MSLPSCGRGNPRGRPLLIELDIAAAVAWRFAHEMLPDAVRTEDHPALATLSAPAEALPEFLAVPFS